MPQAIIDSLRIGPEKNFTYLIACPVTFEAALIDPSFDFDKILAWTKKKNEKISVKFLIATHWHWDHAGGFPEMLKRVPTAKVICHEVEEMRLKITKIPVDKTVKDGEKFKIGQVIVKALHSPGHTDGGCCYIVENHIFTGDTLFVGQCGRTDLEDGSDEKLFSSLQRLKTLPGGMIVMPGHDYGRTPTSTITHEIETNPTMGVRTLAEFKALP